MSSGVPLGRPIFGDGVPRHDVNGREVFVRTFARGIGGEPGIDFGTEHRPLGLGRCRHDSRADKAAFSSTRPGIEGVAPRLWSGSARRYGRTGGLWIQGNRSNFSTRAAFAPRNSGQTASLNGTLASSVKILSSVRPIGK